MENKVFIPTDKVTISLKPNASQYQMDWNENQKVEKICVEEGNEVSLLEIGSPSHPVEYHIAKRAILHLAIATLEDAESSNRKFVTRMSLPHVLIFLVEIKMILYYSNYKKKALLAYSI